MKIITEQVLSASLDKLEPLAEDAIKRLKEYGEKIVVKVKDEYMPLLEGMVKNLTGEMKGIAFGKEVETLDMPTLVSFAKQYIVSSSNEIVVMKVTQEDGFYIYMAYSKDRQLLSTSDNKYLIIKAQGLSQDVEDLFKESEIIILK